MLNEMPELKSGMVVKYGFKTGDMCVKLILLQSLNNSFFGFDLGNNLIDIKKDKIFSICKIKNKLDKDVILFDDNLETIWERKPEIDWSKVDVDTKILVKNFKEDRWKRRYFSKIDGGLVCSWINGSTSFTSGGKDNIVHWNMSVLYEGNESLVGE